MHTAKSRAPHAEFGATPVPQPPGGVEFPGTRPLESQAESYFRRVCLLRPCVLRVGKTVPFDVPRQTLFIGFLFRRKSLRPSRQDSAHCGPCAVSFLVIFAAICF